MLEIIRCKYRFFNCVNTFDYMKKTSPYKYVGGCKEKIELVIRVSSLHC